MPVVRCDCGESVSVAGQVARCPQCGRRVHARVAAGADEPAAEILDFLPEAAETRPVVADTSVSRRMLEALLDPRAIRWLLTLGGALAVVGLVVWLVSVGAFASPIRQAAVFGAGTALVFGAGIWLCLRTRHRLAGEALTFLACVVAPLNLWFYHAQGLLTVDRHLWVAGVVCCALYAATLFVLRRPVFLYAIQAGVALTVLLLVADLGDVGVAALSITFAALGAIAVHAERAFPTEGEFDRRRFGRPLLWGGLGQVAAAVAILAPAQVFAWAEIPEGAISWLIDAQRLDVSLVVATGLWLVAAYVAFYAALVPRFAGGWMVLAAAACLLMAEATVLIGADASAEGAVVALALTAAVACVGVSQLSARLDMVGRDSVPGARHGMSGHTRAALGASVILSALPVLLGYALFARGVMPSFRAFGWERPIDWSFSLAMTLTAACLAASATALRKHRTEAGALRFLTAGAILLAAAGAVRFAELPWSIGASLLALIPLAYLIEGTLRRDDINVGIAYTAFGLFGASAFLAVCHRGFELFIPREGHIETLGTAIVALEAAAFLLLSAARCERSKLRELSAIVSALAAGALAATLWQGLGYVGAEAGWVIPTFVLGALLPLAVSRTLETRSLARPLFVVGMVLLVATTVVTDLRALALAAASDVAWRHVGEAAAVIAACVAAAVLAPSAGYRRLFFTAAGATVAAAMFLLSGLVELTGWQKLEVLCVTAGSLLLVAGHVARFREPVEASDDLVDVALWVGSALVVLPLAVATLHHRFGTPVPSLTDELALATFGVLMLATGLAWRFKSTTLVGGAALGGYLIVLLASLLRRPEVTMGAYLAGAGALLFLAGLALSVYRDRLLALPEKIARREGVFQVLNWR